MTVKCREGSENWFYRFWYKHNDYCEGGFRTKTQAVEAERLKRNELIEKKLHPDDDAAQELTFRQGCEWWLKNVAPTKRSGFVDVGRIPLIADYFGDKLLKDATAEDIRTFLGKVSDLRSAKTPRITSVGKHTQNHYRALIHAIYEALTIEGKYKYANPVKAVKKHKIAKARCRYIHPTEERLLTPAVAKEPDLYDYYLLGNMTGMRISEMRKIRVKDIDLNLKHIYVGDPSDPSKNNESAYVPLDGPQDPDHLVMRLLDRRMAGKGVDDYVLPHWGYTYVKDHFYAICEAVGIKNLKIHDWRHTFAYNCLSQGVKLYIVSKLLRHSSQKVTEDHYGHLAIGNLREGTEHLKPFLTCNRFATGEVILEQIQTQNASIS